ncbi:MAG: hypothetical protein ACI9TY_001061 [Alphaproteobacteria bacterium]|jgi:hypothetical protein
MNTDIQREMLRLYETERCDAIVEAQASAHFSETKESNRKRS